MDYVNKIITCYKRYLHLDRCKYENKNNETYFEI